MKPVTRIVPPSLVDHREAFTEADAERRSLGLLPFPPLLQAVLVVGLVLCIALGGFLWSLLR